LPPAGFGAEPREKKKYICDLSQTTYPIAQRRTNTAQATEREPHTYTAHTVTQRDKAVERNFVRIKAVRTQYSSKLARLRRGRELAERGRRGRGYYP